MADFEPKLDQREQGREQGAERATELQRETIRVVDQAERAAALLKSITPEQRAGKKGAEIARVQSSLGRNLRVLTLVLGLGAGGVYKGMESLATTIATSVHNTLDGLAKLRPTPVDAEEPATPAVEEVAPEITEEASSETIEIPAESITLGDLPSFIDPAQYAADQAASAAATHEQENRIETGTMLGEMLTTTLWQDPAFRALRTSDEIERYIQERVADHCGADDASCSIYHVKQAIAAGLATKVQESVQSGTGSREQLAQLARSARMLTNGGDAFTTFGELDVALASRDPALVSSFLHSDRGHGSSPNTAFLQDYLTPARLGQLPGVYNGLPAADREQVEQALLERSGRLADNIGSRGDNPTMEGYEQRQQARAQAARDQAELQRVANELHISLEGSDDESEEGSG